MKLNKYVAIVCGAALMMVAASSCHNDNNEPPTPEAAVDIARTPDGSLAAYPAIIKLNNENRSATIYISTNTDWWIDRVVVGDETYLLSDAAKNNMHLFTNTYGDCLKLTVYKFAPSNPFPAMSRIELSLLPNYQGGEFEIVIANDNGECTVKGEAYQYTGAIKDTFDASMRDLVFTNEASEQLITLNGDNWELVTLVINDEVVMSRGHGIPQVGTTGTWEWFTAEHTADGILLKVPANYGGKRSFSFTLARPLGDPDMTTVTGMQLGR